MTGDLRDVESGESLDEPWRSMTFRMVGCEACGLVYMRERPRQEHIGRFYSAEYHCYESFEERGRVFDLLSRGVARQKMRELERRFPASSRVLLDYGCGSGTWLDLFRRARAGERGWKLIGTEVHPRLVERLREKGIEAHLCDERDVDRYVAPGSVGVVHHFHVIEHVPDPVAMLRKLRELLVPGGAIVGQTPDVDALERRVFGDAWSQWHVPRHLVLFSKETLRAAAQRAGLEVASLRSSPSSATQWSASFLKRWALHRGRPFRSTAEPLYPALTLAAAPMALLHAGLANLAPGVPPTSHLDFVLRRPA